MSVDGGGEVHYRIDLAFADLMHARVEAKLAWIPVARSDSGRRDAGSMDLFVSTLRRQFRFRAVGESGGVGCLRPVPRRPSYADTRDVYAAWRALQDRKSTRLNSSHMSI